MFVARDHRWTDEAAKAWAIGPENDRHVASEIDGAHCVSVVMQVGRMKPRLAAIGAGPFGRRANEAHTGAGAVEMHLVGGGEQRLDIAGLEEVRRAMRAINDPNRPLPSQLRCFPDGRVGGLRQAGEVEHVAAAQRAGGVATEFAESKIGARAKHQGSREAASDRQVAALPGPIDGADREDLTGGDGERRVVGNGCAIEFHRHVGASERHDGVGVEAQGRTAHGQFERRGLVRIANQPIGAAEGALIHRSARRHADVPEAKAAGQFLQARLRAGRQHFDSLRFEGKTQQRGGRDLAGSEELRAGNGAQIAEIGLNTGNAGAIEHRAQFFDGGRPVRAPDDDLGEHRIVERGDFGAGLDPGVDPCVRGKHHLGQETRAGLEIGVRDFGIEPDLHRGTNWRRGPGGDDVFACRLPDHPFNEVDAEHRLGHRMFDLQPGVDLEEIEIVARRVIDEFDRAGGGIAYGLAKLDSRGMEARAGGVGKSGGRGFLDHLLVAALQRAIAFAEGDDAALAVAENLHFDVARV